MCSSPGGSLQVGASGSSQMGRGSCISRACLCHDSGLVLLSGGHWTKKLMFKMGSLDGETGYLEELPREGMVWRLAKVPQEGCRVS